MKSLYVLWKVLAQECAKICCTSATIDIKTVDSRIKHEGLSFLTITLPDFGKDLQKGLDQGHVDRRLFSAFKRKGELPLFLGGFLDLVFDRTSGRLLDEPNIDAIRCLRQLTLSLSKVAIPCTKQRVAAAMVDFIKCEQEVREFDSSIGSIDFEPFERISSILYRSIFTRVDSDVYNGNIVPRHGPGSTADKLIGNEKLSQRTWTHRLEEVFSFADYLFPSPSYYDMYEGVDFLEPGSEMASKVIPVPKTQKTPRIISMEPTAMQYVQQGLKEAIVGQIERDDFLSNVLGFDDQTPNQRLAKEGSHVGNLATLDLSEASDRVSNQLIRSMLRHHPHLQKGVEACRTRKADVRGHGVVRLAKFAPMGSALCFPFEAMVFLTLVFVGIEQSLNRPLAKKDIMSFKDRVRIYGDDIIVPVDHVHSVVSALELFGARVNRSKSFWNGKFRESCGKEYFDGHDVSIVKIRQTLPARPVNATEVISTVATRNLLYWAGYWDTVKWLDELLIRVLKHYPLVSETSPVLGRQSALGYEIQGVKESTHSPFVKGYVVKAPIPRNEVDGADALLKFFLKRSDTPTFDEDHLERSGRPQSVHIKLRKASPF